MGTDQPSPPGPGIWNGFWTLSLTNERRKHPNIVLQQQIMNLHKEKGGAGFKHRSRAAWVSSRNFQESGSTSTPQLHFTETSRSSPFRRSRPLSWTVGICEPHPKTGSRMNSGRFPATRRGLGRIRNVQSEEGREGWGCQAPTDPSSHPAPGSFAFCSRGDED